MVSRTLIDHFGFRGCHRPCTKAAGAFRLTVCARFALVLAQTGLGAKYELRNGRTEDWPCPTEGQEMERKRSALGGSLGAIAWAPAAALIAEHFLFELAALLCFERQGGCGPRQQASDSDGFAGFIAIAVIAGINAGY